MVFYLKVNRNENYTYRNLQNWIKTLEIYPNAVIYIICDNEEVKKNIFEKVNFGHALVHMMGSVEPSEEIKHFLVNTCDKWWRKAGLAHLSTFVHAKENGFKEFWNIDADDTYICLNEKRRVELLLTAEQHARSNSIALFSLDMWRTRYSGIEWSFGVTYTDNSVDWVKFILDHCLDKAYKKIGAQNFDRYFMYLRELNIFSIETFYFENLKFIHYSDDVFYRIIKSGLYHWKEGYLELPILAACIDMEGLTHIPIAEDVVKLDIGIKDEEASDLLYNETVDKALLQILIKEYKKSIRQRTKKKKKNEE